MTLRSCLTCKNYQNSFESCKLSKRSVTSERSNLGDCGTNGTNWDEDLPNNDTAILILAITIVLTTLSAGLIYLS